MNTFIRRTASKTMILLLSLVTLYAVAAGTGKDPREVIQESTDRVLQTVERQKEKSEDRVTRAMAEELLQVLEPAVDFNSIARGVMGKHRRGASEQQVERFVAVFKDSLSQLYMRSFQSLEVKKVEVLPLPEDFDPERADKATVQMLATTEGGESFNISYSMRTNEQGRWVVRNIIADGINMGLTYMNQFDGAVKRHGNIEGAIASWPKEMENETFDSKKGES